MRKQLYPILFGGVSFVAPFVFSSIGDSTAAQATASGTTTSYYDHEPLCWLRWQSDHRVSFPIANNLAVAGTYIAQTSTQIASLDGLAAKPTDLLIATGTNDLAGGNSLATMQADYLAMLASVAPKSYLKRIWLTPITPRSSGMNATLYQRRRDFNAWLAQIVSGAAASGLPSAQRAKLQLLSVDFMTDVDGDNPKSGYVQADGLHYNAPTGQGLGSQLATYVNARTPANPPVRTSSGDIYNASTNPFGSLLKNGGVNRGLMQGTSGSLQTLTSLTPTGVVATNWKLARGAGTSNGSTVVGAKEAGDAGQLVTYTIGGTGGATSEIVSLEYIGAAFGIAAADGFAAGDTVVMEGELEVISNSGPLGSVTLRLASNGASPNLIVQDAVRTNSGIKLPSAVGTYFYRTPPMVIPASTTFLNPVIQANFDGSGNTGSAQWAVRNMAVRKVA